MTRKKDGSLIGRPSSSSKNNSGLFIVAIVAVVAVVSLFLMTKGGSSQVVSEDVVVVDEAGNLVGEAFRDNSPGKLLPTGYFVEVPTKINRFYDFDFLLSKYKHEMEGSLLGDCGDVGGTEGDCFTTDMCIGCFVCVGNSLVPCTPANEEEGDDCVEEICSGGISACKSSPMCSEFSLPN